MDKCLGRLYPSILFSCLAACLLVPLSLRSQTRPVSMADILRTYQRDSLYQQMLAAETWAGRQSFRGSWIREWEFRTETDRFEWSRQEFTVRLSPRGLRENSFRSIRQQRRAQSLAIERYSRQVRVLKERYEALVTTYLARLTLQQKQAQRSLLQEKIRLLALQFGENKLDPVDLAKTETDLFEVELSLQSLFAELQAGNEQFQLWLGRADSVELVLSPMISIAGIQGVLDHFEGLSLVQVPKVQEAALQLDDEYLSWQIDRVQDNRWLNFVQAKVRGDDMGFDNPEFSLGLAISFPLIQENKRQRAIYQLRHRLAQTRLEQLKIESQGLEAETRQKLQELIIRWKSMDQRIRTGLTRQTLDRLHQQAEQRPLTMLLLQEQLLLQGLLRLAIEGRVYRAYLEWLAVSGQLADPSPRNFLSAQTERLGE